MKEYIQSLRDGLSQEEAFEKHFQPLLTDLETRFKEWLGKR